MATTRRVVKLLAVADAVHLVEDRHGRVAGAQEVRVQRVHVAARLHRASGGDERLAGHLAAEHALAVLVGGDAAEDVHLDGFEIEQVDQVVERVHAGARSGRSAQLGLRTAA